MYMHVYTCTYTNLYMHTYTYIYTHVYIYVYTYKGSSAHEAHLQFCQTNCRKTLEHYVIVNQCIDTDVVRVRM